MFKRSLMLSALIAFAAPGLAANSTVNAEPQSYSYSIKHSKGGDDFYPSFGAVKGQLLPSMGSTNFQINGEKVSLSYDPTITSSSSSGNKRPESFVLYVDADNQFSLTSMSKQCGIIKYNSYDWESELTKPNKPHVVKAGDCTLSISLTPLDI